jgi:hypothetical protein
MIQIPFEHYGKHDSWTEVIILWDDVMGGPRYPIREILAWIKDAPGGRYHLYGFNSTEGFAFRFENPADAVHFKLRWL